MHHRRPHLVTNSVAFPKFDTSIGKIGQGLRIEHTHTHTRSPAQRVVEEHRAVLVVLVPLEAVVGVHHQQVRGEANLAGREHGGGGA